MVDSPEEQEAWRDYLRGQGVECTDVFDRGAFRSIYVRDPDGHIVEIATRGPGFPAPGPPEAGDAGVSVGLACAAQASRRGERVDLGGRLAAQPRGEARRWRSVIEPIVFVSFIGIGGEEAAAARAAPAVLAHQQVGDGHALRLPGAVEHDVRDGQLALGRPGA